MSPSPAKRRKLSPDPPADAPPPPMTPSRIPGPRDTERRPSFASPTKASLAKAVVTQDGGGGEREGAGGARESLFVTQSSQGEASSAVPKGAEQEGPVEGEGEGVEGQAQTDKGSARTPQTQRSLRRISRGGMASAPRRRSQSPQKQAPKPTESTPGPVENSGAPGGPNPFQKKGLRRSPVPPTPVPAEVTLPPPTEKAADEVVEPAAPTPTPIAKEPTQPATVAVAEPANPFKKKGLRRSDPEQITPEANVPETSVSAAATVADPANPFKKKGLRRSGPDQTTPKPSAAELSQPVPATAEEPVPATAEEAANPFEKRGLRRSDLEQTTPTPSAPEPSQPIADAVAEPAKPLEKRGPRRSGPDQTTTNPSAAESSQQTTTTVTEPEPLEKKGLRISVPELATPKPITSDPSQPETAAVTEPAKPLEKRGRPRRSGLEQTTPKPSAAEPSQSATAAVTEPAHLFKKGGLRRSGPTPTAPAETPQPEVPPRDEPELPPTPTQLGIPDPVVTTAPAGIHKTTPSKRGGKRPRGAKPASSPLKPRTAPPPPEPEPEPAAEPERPAKRRKPSPAASRHLVPADPLAAKKAQRARLRAELAQLETDARLADKESERLRRHHAAGKPGDAPRPANSDAILDLLLRCAQPPAPLGCEEPPPQAPPTLAQRAARFLPFAGRARAPPPLVPGPDVAGLPGLRPLEVADALPFLRVFTPLAFASTMSVLPPTPGEDEAAAILQAHTITATAPGGLFHARVGVVVDAGALRVVRVEVERVDGSAEAEVGSWVRERAGAGGVLGGDVGAVFWAMAGWVEGAVRRGRFWCWVEAGGWKGGEDEEEGGKYTTRELLPQMGRTAMAVRLGGGVEVTVEWRIGFDWTGEAEHAISAWALVPGDCESSSSSSFLSRLRWRNGDGLLTSGLQGADATSAGAWRRSRRRFGGWWRAAGRGLRCGLWRRVCCREGWVGVEWEWNRDAGGDGGEEEGGGGGKDVVHAFMIPHLPAALYIRSRVVVCEGSRTYVHACMHARHHAETAAIAGTNNPLLYVCFFYATNHPPPVQGASQRTVFMYYNPPLSPSAHSTTARACTHPSITAHERRPSAGAASPPAPQLAPLSRRRRP